MPKPKFSKIAYKQRFCELCQKRLTKEEAFVCKQCYFELNGGVDYD